MGRAGGFLGGGFEYVYLSVLGYISSVGASLGYACRYTSQSSGTDCRVRAFNLKTSGDLYFPKGKARQGKAGQGKARYEPRNGSLIDSGSGGGFFGITLSGSPRARYDSKSPTVGWLLAGGPQLLVLMPRGHVTAED